MNRTEYVKAIATVTGYTQKDVKAVLDAAQTVAYEAMAKEEEVKVFDGLTLSGVHKDACVKRNPLTGEDVQVAAKTAPKAKFGKFAKDSINA
jgi:DNA-binding protein HU-beta